MFSLHRGDLVLPVTADGAEGKFYVAAGLDSTTKQVILKVVNAEGRAIDAKIRIAGIDFLLPPTEAIVLSGNPDDENSIRRPMQVAPVKEPLSAALGMDSFGYSFKPYSLTILKTAQKQ